MGVVETRGWRRWRPETLGVSVQVALDRDGLLEGRPVLERCRRDRDRRCDDRPILVVALRVGIVRAVAVAVESLGRDLDRLAQGGPQRVAALGLRPVAAIDAAPGAAGPRAEQFAQVLRDVAPPA